ncbi:hypothetical protein ALO43_101510 [Pseudomonas tremae]|uniref:Uncharacterized protein n=1 Tax=Pseudomonas tremae TaxID=200454 RepID=A0AA40TWK5_9PSED|nr:hypothetical protein ALO57_101288 [Pseudomonas coronafaciens pv. oryzae]KPY20700.1 hypothetical protein ALO89_101872 [Pseudomonas coronafaciens pv. porri]KPZ06116.1 hypothetical protein ALO43_101510 [Pseudomonas tremae]KPZ22663.1 hypothetical protein ALO38_101262 [Pseudomonas coronafaciens pv. zizaniae]RMM76935.1 hypothetical protein ALQ71_101953 [Pseudomonas coronafaciens pv. striafaciens]RMN88948.1 hypothetical protein ALQ50_101481 [Pseudomonas coronafaciens pv. coronafaciens]RMP24164.1 
MPGIESGHGGKRGRLRKRSGILTGPQVCAAIIATGSDRYLIFLVLLHLRRDATIRVSVGLPRERGHRFFLCA